MKKYIRVNSAGGVVAEVRWATVDQGSNSATGEWVGVTASLFLQPTMLHLNFCPDS